MHLTSKNLFDVFTPLLLALHEKKVLDIAEVPHFYEDVLARRRLENKEDLESLDFLQQVVLGLNRLSVDVKAKEKDQRN